MRSLFRSLVLAATIAVFFTGNSLVRAQDPSRGAKALGSVDGVVITEAQARTAGAADLDALEMQMSKARAEFARREHQILESALSRLIEDKLLQAEAAKRGISKEELLEKELKRYKQDATAEEIDSFYESNKERINRPEDEVAAQIGKYLKQEKYAAARESFLKRLEKDHKVIRSLEPLRFSIDSGGRPALGPPSAPVTLVVFSDFQCPYCKKFSSTLAEVSKKYGDKVRIVFRQFPLTKIHPDAMNAAEAALCAADQKRFWEMHDLLFQDQSDLEIEALRKRANKLGLDVNAFNACLDSSQHAAQIHEDIVAGTSAGADSTPTTFVNGRYLNGAQPLNALSAIIEEELKAK
jgi:predicted DsbA family dithiol-disulfide isomerase